MNPFPGVSWVRTCPKLVRRRNPKRERGHVSGSALGQRASRLKQPRKGKSLSFRTSVLFCCRREISEGVTALGQSLSHHFVRTGRRVLDSRLVDPCVVNLDQGANRHVSVESLIAPTRRFGSIDIFLSHGERLTANFCQELKR